MEWNELQAQWQSRDADARSLTRPQASARLWRRIRSRDLIETAAAVLLAPCFGIAAYALFAAGFRVSAAFSLFLVAAIVYVPLRLRRARRMIPEPDPNRPVREFLAAERAALLGQAEMLRSVARWYCGPIGIGVIGFFAGIAGATMLSLGYGLLVVALCAGIEYANRHAAERGIRPAIDRIDDQIRQLEDEDHA